MREIIPVYDGFSFEVETGFDNDGDEYSAIVDIPSTTDNIWHFSLQYESDIIIWNINEIEKKEIKKDIAKFLWKEFGEIPMDLNTECIEDCWMEFKKGTHREDIWHWFEETFDVSVAIDLMY